MSGEQKLDDEQAAALIRKNDDFEGDDYDEEGNRLRHGFDDFSDSDTITDDTKPKAKSEPLAEGFDSEEQLIYKRSQKGRLRANPASTKPLEVGVPKPKRKQAQKETSPLSKMGDEYVKSLKIMIENQQEEMRMLRYANEQRINEIEFHKRMMDEKEQQFEEYKLRQSRQLENIQREMVKETKSKHGSYPKCQ